MHDQSNNTEVVKRFLQLEFSREQELQDIVTLTAEICQTPIALITFMDGDLQWIRFKVGTSITRNSREDSFCKHLINKTDLLVVPDTLLDERFTDHPYVDGEANIRFYAGTPLLTHNGEHIGTLCVFDTKPQELSSQQEKMLRILGKQVTHLMELEMSVKLLKEHVEEINNQKQRIISSEIKLRSFLDSSAACHILLGKNMEVLNFNKAGSEFLQNVYRKEITPGMVASEHLHPSFAPLFNTVFPEVLAGHSRTLEYLVKYGDSGNMWWEITFSPAYDHHSEIIGVSINSIDINQRKLHSEKITIQNKALARIAHIQSHGLRKPVASILGLMNVLRADDYADPKDCLQQMEKAALELDETIHAIVRQTELIPL